MIAAGWLVAVVLLALAAEVVTVALFLRQQGTMVRAVVAKNSSELAMTEAVAIRVPKPRIVHRPVDLDEEISRQPRAMGL